MRRLHHDFETASEVDIKTVGVAAYVRHESTRVLMLSYAFDDEPVRLWDSASGEPLPHEVVSAITDPSVTKIAWNAAFERGVWKHVLGIDSPVEQWKDPMVLAYSMSMPGSLEEVGKIIRLPEELQKAAAAGKKYIRLFSKPQKPTKKHPYRWRDWRTDPEDWAQFGRYCVQDTVAEREIMRRLEKWDLSPQDWADWHLDQKINEAGLPIDRELVRGAIKLYKAVQADYLRRLERLTGVANAASTPQLMEWLRAQGYRWPDLQKATVEKALKDETISPLLRQALELRRQASRTAGKKFTALENATCDDGLLRQILQFLGAGRTGRWAGRIFQPQNLARPIKELEKPEAMQAAIEVVRSADENLIWMLYDEPMSVLSSLVRPAVRAPEGYILDDADLSSIEYVLLGWQAECHMTHHVLSNGLDAYKHFGVHMLGKPYEEISKAERNLCKPPVLGCGYRLGGGEVKGDIKTGLLGYADSMKIDMSREQAHRAVEVYRSLYPAIVAFWDVIEQAARKVILGRVTRAEAGPLEFDRSGPFLRMRLPSGRYLYYIRPRIEDKETPWGEIKPTITYEGLDQKTRRWCRQKTHGGKLVENSTQAIARDLLMHGMRLAHEKGIDIRLHVHDQVVALRRLDQKKPGLQELMDCLTVVPPWGRGMKYPMILGAAGFSSPFFTKD